MSTCQSGFVQETPKHERHWLVVEPYPSEKYEFVSWDDEIPNLWKNKTCSKPPIRFEYPLFETTDNVVFIRQINHTQSVFIIEYLQYEKRLFATPLMKNPSSLNTWPNQGGKYWIVGRDSFAAIINR